MFNRKGPQNLFIRNLGLELKVVYLKIRVRIKSLVSNKEIIIEALETKQLSGAYISILGKEISERFENLGFASADVPMTSGKGVNEIGLLVGSDNYWKFVGNRIKRLDKFLVVVETMLGFCIFGSVSEDKGNDERSMNLVVYKESLSEQLSLFWHLENLGIETEEDTTDISNHEILKSFKSSIEYNSNRYKVRLPWKPEMLDDNRIAKIFKYESAVFYWTGSTNVYCWVRSRPDRFKPFVKNRVEEIQKLSDPSDWNHCPRKENPADFLQEFFPSTN
ncbi:hypothetical protein NPIL_118461 [Nephila pilipes]|uniref:Uncharacterized protein n=1 Tax=Nephila pilipes TaxID=299642 RepID=A0A8X6NRD7_NEPPI|nr:hypothetical protein NPIL_118461 [Nephila pilipes]